MSWTDSVRIGEVLQGVRKERNIVRTVNIRKGNWIGYVLRGNCLLKQITEGKVDGKDRSDGKMRKKR